MLEKDSSNVSFHTIRTFLQLFSHTREKTTPSRGTHVQTCSACVLATRPIFNFLSLSIKDSNTAGVSSGSRLVKQPGWQRDKQAFTPMESWESPEWEHGTKYTGNTLKRSFISQSFHSLQTCLGRYQLSCKRLGRERPDQAAVFEDLVVAKTGS